MVFFTRGMMSINIHPQELFDLNLFEHTALFQGCAYPWEALERLSAYLTELSLGVISIQVPNFVILHNPQMISIGEGTVIEPGVMIQGPCVIGKQCVIRHGAYLRGDTLVGDHCVIGHDTEIKHSILMNHVAAPHFNYVGDSILGNRVNLGAGVKCSNVRLDKGEVVLKIDGMRIPTGLKKLGAIIGDGAQLGCNAVSNPGTVFAKGAVCFPCMNVGGYVPQKSKVIGKT